MNQNQADKAKKDEVLEGVLQEFAKLAAIPRKSGHEQAVSDFLKSYLSELGFTVTQDEANNIIADKKASAGFEATWIWSAWPRRAMHMTRSRTP